MSAHDSATQRGEQNSSHQTPQQRLYPSWGVSHELRNGLDLPAILRDVLSIVMRSVDADGGSILILDEGGWPSHWFVHKHDQGTFTPPAGARPIIGRGIVAWVIQHRQGDWVDDVAGDSRWLSLFDFHVGPGPGSDAQLQGAALCLPFLVYGRVVAVLTLIHHRPGFFNARHLELLDSIAERVAPPIENARLYEMVRHRAEQMAALYEVAINISADQPLDRLLDTIVAQAMDLLRCQGGGVYLWREQESELELVAAYDPEIDLRGTRVARGEGLIGQVFETGDPLALDESNIEDWPHTSGGDIASGLPTAAALATPLVWQGQPLGVLMTFDRTPGRHFSHGDRHLLTLLANQSVATIASVQLHEQTARRLQELTFLNETIQDITATLDLDEIFAVLTKRVKDLLEIEACSIALVDRESNELVFRAASGGGSETVIGERVPWGHGIVGAAAKLGKPLNVFDVEQDGRFYQDIDEKQAKFVTHSILAVPMVSRGRVVGVVEGLNKPGGFDSEDERLLSALASLTASVVDNANLVSTRRELEQLREDLSHMIVHDLRSPLGTVANSLDLSQKLLGGGESDQFGHLLDIASRATRRLLNMVDSLLDISRLEAGHELASPKPLSVKDLIQSAVDQLALYKQRKRMRLNIRLPEHLPLVLADEGMIERVLVNLINNALKFTPANGEVTVSVGIEADFLWVRVRDNGPGILPEHQRRIFDKFAQVRQQDGMKGIGLGLAFCRLAVEAHGGRIWVESASGQGSTFVFTLPLDPAPLRKGV